MDNIIYVIGIGEDGAGGLSPKSLGIVRDSEVLMGGERQLDFFADYSGRKIVLRGGLAAFAGKLEEVRQTRRTRRTVVLASGDPLFFGIGGYLVQKFGPGQVEVIPHYSSVQLAFARLGDSWQDAELISLHGRPIRGLAQRMDGQRKIAILTDDRNTPAEIAAYLLEFGMTEYEAFVCEQLGGPEEKCRFWELTELAELTAEQFAGLNILILRQKKAEAVRRRGFAYPDEAFAQRRPDKGLITKREVRALVLSELNLSDTSVVWDIGSGSGAVAAECARIARSGQVCAVEKDGKNLPNMEANRLEFRADYEIIIAKAPQGLELLPAPDAIFIGGSGGELAAVIALGADRLQPSGRMVITAITVETLQGAMTALERAGMNPEITLLQASRGKPICGMTRFEGMNPVYVVRGEKPGGEQHSPHQSQRGK